MTPLDFCFLMLAIAAGIGLVGLAHWRGTQNDESGWWQ